MASNPFKSMNAPLVSRPKPTTVPDRKTPVKPPTRTPDRRRIPGDPRVRPKRPVVNPKQPNPKVPVKPWTLPKDPLAKVPFGKLKPTQPTPWHPKVWRKFSPWWFTPGVAVLGWIEGQPYIDFAAYGFYKCCSIPLPKDGFKRVATTAGMMSLCQVADQCGLSGQTLNGDYPGSIPADQQFLGEYIYLGMKNLAGTRMTYSEIWHRPRPGLGQPNPQRPEMVPITDIEPIIGPMPWFPPLPPWLVGDPWPLSPEPIPVAPPLGKPDPSPEPYGPPAPVTVSPTTIPAITIDTGFDPKYPPTTLDPFPDIHVKEPPTGPDKEKKKKLDKAGTLGWLKALERMGTSYLEMDDFVSAIYKGLPWHLRRWRGRDGIWRDRDHTTAGRLERIYNLFGKLDIRKAIHEVATQEVADRVIGTIGQTLSDRAAALGEAGLYNRPVGFQYGNNQKTKNWAEFDRARKEAAAAEMMAGGPRTYKVKYYDRSTNSWVWREKTRPWTQIPWYRQKSYHPGLAKPGMAEWWDLTEAEKEAETRTVDRYYYGPTDVANPIVFPDGKDRWYGN